MDAADLKRMLADIDGRGYKAYRQLKGSYSFPGFTLFIDHVQSDPFAAPSRMRARVAQEGAVFDNRLYEGAPRRIALEDLLARSFAAAIRKFVRGDRGTGKSGQISIDSGGQEIIERTAATVNGQWVEVRFRAGLPAAGRRCRAADAMAMLTEELPRVVEAALFARAHDDGVIARHVETAEDQDRLRGELAGMGLVAFLEEGAVLPRRSGVSDLPLEAGKALALQVPPELRTEVELPNRGRVAGIGIPAGVTLIVGGGYHGKSTLLKAIERGVYNHVPGDGREGVVTVDDAVKIRAEDGRGVEKVDISPFISNLPFGIDTVGFSTDNASGSTSQAANIIEALEAGASLIILDEDTSATNFMIRDELMQRLVAKEKEPITPFIDRVRALYEERGVSTILVMGGSGDYFEVADTVIVMESYEPRVVTDEARAIAAARKDSRVSEAGRDFVFASGRVPVPGSIDPRRGRRDKLAARGTEQLVFGRDVIELAAVEQLVDPSQTRAIGDLIRYGLRRGLVDGKKTLTEFLDGVLGDVAELGLDIISPHSAPGGPAGTSIEPAAGRSSPAGYHPGEYALPRRQELAAAINRMRGLKVK